MAWIKHIKINDSDLKELILEVSKMNKPGDVRKHKIEYTRDRKFPREVQAASPYICGRFIRPKPSMQQ